MLLKDEEPEAVSCCKRRDGLCDVTPGITCESSGGDNEGEDSELVERWGYYAKWANVSPCVKYRSRY